MTPAQQAQQNNRTRDGKYAQRQGADPGQLALDTQPDWGDLSHLGEHSRTPWGKPNHVYHLAPGIAEVSCPGHGGIKLSPERNRAIPKPFRSTTGWYEEDLDWAIPAHFHAEAFAGDRLGSINEIHATTAQKLRDYYPDEWTQTTGETLTPETSWGLAQRQQKHDTNKFREENSHRYVAHPSADNTYTPNGWVAVQATCADQQTTRTFAIPEPEWHTRRDRLAFDPGRYVDITDAVGVDPEPRLRAEAPPVGRLEPDYSGLSPAAADRAHAELSKRWRWPDGQAGTVLERYEGQVNGKMVSLFAGDTSATYYLTDQDSHVIPVSKAAWDALPGVPNLMTERDVIRLEYSRAEVARDKLAPHTPKPQRDRVMARHAAAKARYVESERASSVRWDERRLRRREAVRGVLLGAGVELGEAESGG